jgi:hypothetical protein
MTTLLGRRHRAVPSTQPRAFARAIASSLALPFDYDLMKPSRSALITSAFVVIIQSGRVDVRDQTNTFAATYRLMEE